MIVHHNPLLQPMTKLSTIVNMNKAVLGFIVGIVIILIAGLFLFSGEKKPEISELPNPENHEYYWSATCLHCKAVNEFMDDWEHKDEFTLDKYETTNPTNASRLQTRALACNIPASQIGVPLIFTPQGECIIGDQPIIDYLNSLFPDEENS